MTAAPQSRRFEVLDVDLDGAVALPPDPAGVVLFAHGLGGSGHDERDVLAARELNNVGIATVMVDLLTPAEQRIDAATAEFRFDAAFLGVRVIALADLLAAERETSGLPGGVLGSHSGAAAALIAAAARPQWVRAVASRGGRPELAGEFLQLARAPTLLVVGEYDHPLRELNEEAADRIAGPNRVAVVPGAGHLFDEPGAAAMAAELTRDFFRVLLQAREQAHSR
ncbi:MAG: dienelactone hydrolase [Pseudonocardia sp.]|nr:dienelactone hydrolase [Pseudonocardia sp.]